MSIIGIGTDIVSIDRIHNALRRNDKLKTRILSIDEQKYVADNHERFAAHFATKEAVAKALGIGIGKISWLDIELRHNQYGKPYVELYNQAIDYFCNLGGKNIFISISHERKFAIAVAIIEN